MNEDDARDARDGFAGSAAPADAARWLGKRARPDGRQYQPPRKRYAADGPDDPGFVR